MRRTVFAGIIGLGLLTNATVFLAGPGFATGFRQGLAGGRQPTATCAVNPYLNGVDVAVDVYNPDSRLRNIQTLVNVFDAAGSRVHTTTISLPSVPAHGDARAHDPGYDGQNWDGGTLTCTTESTGFSGG